MKLISIKNEENMVSYPMHAKAINFYKSILGELRLPDSFRLSPNIS